MIVFVILLKLILYVILFLLGLLLILILSPIKAYASFSTRHLLVKGHYLFGLLHVHYENKKIIVKLLGFKIINQENKKDARDELTKETSASETKKSKKKKKKLGLPSKHVISLSLQLVKKLIKIIFSKKLHLSITFGLDDPYYTGLSQMIYQIIVYPLNRIKGYHLICHPVYDDLLLEYEGEGHLSFSLIQLILPCLRFIIRKPIRDYFQLFKWKKNA